MDLERALGYPYNLHGASFVLHDGRVAPWTHPTDFANRHPVFACGSNQSPVQLARKFPKGCLWVMAGWLSGADSVYSAHVTSYGSIAATYYKCSGVRSRQMVCWLDDAQLETLHASEALGLNYQYRPLDNIVFESDCAKTLTCGFQYESLHGPLLMKGAPVALKSIAAEGRIFPALSQKEVQQRLRDRLAPDLSLNDFIAGPITDANLRQDRTQRLKQLS